METKLKKQIIDGIISVEGGYVNEPDDSGKETRYGITVAVARDNGYTGDMKELPISLAFNIYSNKYWDAVQADELVKLSEKVTREVVDTAINMGPKQASLFLQRALNVLNDRVKLYADIKVDGDIGDKTTTALRSYLAVRNEAVLVKALNCLQGAFYIELAEKREKDERFLYGWLKNRISL